MNSSHLSEGTGDTWDLSTRGGRALLTNPVREETICERKASLYRMIAWKRHLFEHLKDRGKELHGWKIQAWWKGRDNKGSLNVSDAMFFRGYFQAH